MKKRSKKLLSMLSRTPLIKVFWSFFKKGLLPGLLAFALGKRLMDAVTSFHADGLIGTWRRFGMLGPVYEIVSAGSALPNGDQMMRVRIVESSEEVNYKLTEILEDPRER